MTPEDLGLVQLRCDLCGGRWAVRPAGPAVLFHQCIPPKRGFDWRTPRERVDADRRAWALTRLGAAFEAAVGDRALLPVDEGDDDE